MTRCCRDSVNLKSSVYNQTGQTYVDQVSQHRRMCMHFRRVIQAKCVVDARNPRYARAVQKRCRPVSCRLRFSDDCPSDDTIDRLAYDSRHHPSEIIRVTCRKSSSKERSCSRCRQSLANDASPAVCPCARPCPVKDYTTSTPARYNLDCFNAPRASSTSRARSRTREHSRTETHARQQLCTSKLAEYSPQHSIRSRKSAHSAGPRSSSGEDTAAGIPASPETFRELAERKGDEARYAKFVYDITQEIVQCGLYTDRELKEVFEKHLEKNSERLNKRKMLYEIYQLKISLSMGEDTEEEEEEDEAEADLVYAEKFAKLRVPKPPTPPRCLNENKVIEKLETFGRRRDDERGPDSPLPNRNVVLVDPNPEFLVTERDVLATLADEDVSPEQIQRIYRSLCQRSKDVSTCEPVQVGNEMTYSHRLRRADRCSSASSLDKAYMKERLRGILRKESTDFASKALSPELASRQYASSHYQQKTEALEKCESWRQGLCECEKTKALEVPEKDKRQSPAKTALAEKERPGKKEPASTKDQKLRKNQKLKTFGQSPQKVARPSTAAARFGSSTDSSKQGSRSSAESSRKESRASADSAVKGVRASEQMEKDSPARFLDSSSAVFKIIMEEKPDSPSENLSEVEASEKSASADEHEEIEEEIESDADEALSSQRSPRESAVSEKSDTGNEKELPSVREESEIQEEAASLSGASSASEESSAQEPSDSESSEDAEATLGSPKSPAARGSPLPRRKEEVTIRRYSTVHELYQRIAEAADKHEPQQGWSFSEASSDTASSGSEQLAGYEGASYPASPPGPDAGLAQRPVRKRTSSGQSGYKVMDSWNQKLAEITSDFYRHSEARYCEPRCRAAATRGCAENCKFVKTNCRNLSDPTDCLVKVTEKSESSVSTDSF